MRSLSNLEVQAVGGGGDGVPQVLVTATKLTDAEKVIYDIQEFIEGMTVGEWMAVVAIGSFIVPAVVVGSSALLAGEGALALVTVGRIANAAGVAGFNATSVPIGLAGALGTLFGN